MTPPISRISGISRRDRRSRSLNGIAGSRGGLRLGFASDQRATKPMNSSTSIKPGNRPATNSRAIDSSVATP